MNDTMNDERAIACVCGRGGRAVRIVQNGVITIIACDTCQDDALCTMCDTAQRIGDDDMCASCRASFRAAYVEDITREYTSHVRDMLNGVDAVATDVRMIGTRQASFTITVEGETFTFNVTNTSAS